MLSQYLLIHSEAIKATIKEIQGINSKAAIYDPSLAHKGGGQGVKLTGYLGSPHTLSQYLLIYSEAIKATIKEIKAKTQNRLFYDPSLTHKGGSGVKLTDYLDSPYMLSQYLLIHSDAIKATIKEI